MKHLKKLLPVFVSLLAATIGLLTFCCPYPKSKAETEIVSTAVFRYTDSALLGTVLHSRFSPLDIRDRTGVYHYKYPDSHLNWDNYILLRQNNDTVVGLFYGTTDEFIDAREGYTPGYFVLPMEQLSIIGNQISFVLRPKSSDFFTKPIPRNTVSSAAAILKGYTHWDNYDYYDFILYQKYNGLFEDSGDIHFVINSKGNNINAQGHKYFVKEQKMPAIPTAYRDTNLRYYSMSSDEKSYADDVYLVLKQYKDSVTGYFYGTTDEFSQERDSFKCGYFVLPMEDLNITAGKIHFVLEPKRSDFFTRPIPHNILSSDEAVQNGFVQWEAANKHVRCAMGGYNGQFLDSATIRFDNGEYSLNERIFRNSGNLQK
jgi:hypothetical protein